MFLTNLGQKSEKLGPNLAYTTWCVAQKYSTNIQIVHGLNNNYCSSGYTKLCFQVAQNMVGEVDHYNQK